MSAQIVQENENSLVIVKLPGAVLRQARERKGLTIAQIAHGLRLEPSVIEALERDDYDKLPSSTFVAGYIRGYARRLGMAPEPLIAEYQRIYGEEPAGKYLKHSSLKEKIGNERRIRLSRSHVLVGAGVILVSLLLITKPWTMISDISLPTGTTAAPAESDQPQGQTITLEASALPEGAQAPAPAATPSVDTLTTPLTPVAEATPAPATDTAAVAATRVTLTASGDAWVEVRDSTGKRLIYQMLRSGQSRSAEGVAPIDVVLGNGHNVSVSVNGQPFDHSGAITGTSSRAQFKVGGSASE